MTFEKVCWLGSHPTCFFFFSFFSSCCQLQLQQRSSCALSWIKEHLVTCLFSFVFFKGRIVNTVPISFRCLTSYLKVVMLLISNHCHSGCSGYKVYAGITGDICRYNWKYFCFLSQEVDMSSPLEALFFEASGELSWANEAPPFLFICLGTMILLSFSD